MTFCAMGHLTTARPGTVRRSVVCVPIRARRAEGPRSDRPMRRSRPGARRSRRGRLDGAAENEERRHRHRVGNAEQGAHVVLAADGHRRHHAGQALGPRREQQAPYEGVDGGPADEGVAGKVAVDRRERGQVGQHEQECRGDVEGLGETRVRRAAALGEFPGPGEASASAARSVTGAQGTSPADIRARYSYHPVR